MAYMSQDKKKKIAAALKKVMPKGWKYSLRVDRHSTIVMTIRKAPVNLIAEFIEGIKATKNSRVMDEWDLQQHNSYLERIERDQHVSVRSIGAACSLRDSDTPCSLSTRAVLIKAWECLNLDNYDKSDVQTDYFCVGHYAGLQIGDWDKPFEYIAA